MDSKRTELTGHELGKIQRKQKILDAARDIINDSGRATISMRAIAEAAGVSPATPYNLFGSKKEIMHQLFNQNLQEYMVRVEELAHGDALLAIFETLRLAREMYEADTTFFKSVLSLLFQAEQQDLKYSFTQPRYYFFRKLIEKAMQQGSLLQDTPSDLCANACVHIFLSTVLSWVNDEVSFDELERDVIFGFGAILLGFSSRNRRQTILEKMKVAEANLS